MAKIKKQIDYWIHHVWVLFALLVSTALLILYLACREELLLILVLFFVGFVTLYFTSNMVIVMLFSIVFTGLLYIINIGQSRGSLWQTMYLGGGMSIEGMTDASGIDVQPVPSNQPVPSTQPSSTAELLAHSFPNTPTTPEDIEKLKLQIDLLDKVEKLGPLISTVSSLSSYMKTDK